MVKYRDIYESVKTTSRCHKHFLKFLLENPVMDPKEFRKAFLHIYMELVAKEPVENLRRIRALPEDGLTVLLKELMKKMNELAGGLGLKLSQIDFESASPFTAPETRIVLYSTRPMNPGLIAAGEWTHDELYLMHHFVELLRDSPDHQMFYARAEDIGRSLPNKMSIEKIHELIDGLINSGWLDITANEEIFLGRRAAIELEPVLLGQGPGGGWNACAACRRVVYTKLVWKCSTCGDLCHPFCYRRYAKTMREAGAKHIQCPTVAKGCTAVYHIDDRDGTENLFCAGRPCRDEKMDEKKEDTDSDDDEDDDDEEVKEEEEDEAMDEN